MAAFTAVISMILHNIYWWNGFELSVGATL